MKKNKRYGSRDSRPYLLPSNRVINIDTEVDFLLAELIIKKKIYEH